MGAARSILKTLWLVLFLTVCVQSYADSIGNVISRAWKHPDVQAASDRMKLDQQQYEQFNVVLRNYRTELTRRVDKILRNNQSDFDRKMRSANNSLVKEMNKEVAGFLREDQIPAYNEFRDVQQKELRLNCKTIKC